MGDETDEMEHVIVLGGDLRLFLHHEGILSSEAVVSNADFIRIADSMSLLSWRKPGSERLKVGEFITDIDLWSVHQNGEDGLGSAGIVNDLVGEKQLRVVLAECLWFGWLSNPLEKEDKSVDGPVKLDEILVNKAHSKDRINLLDFIEFFVFECHKLFDLNAFDADFLNQLRKHTFRKFDVNSWRENRFHLPGSDSIVHHF